MMKKHAGSNRNSFAGRFRVALFAAGMLVAGVPSTVAATITGASMTPMGFLDPSYPSSRAMGVSSDGTWVVGYSKHTTGLYHAVKWDGTSFTDLGDLAGGTASSGDQSWGYSISSNGSYVAGTGTIGYEQDFGFFTITQDANRPFKTPPMTDISGDSPSSTSGEAWAISNDGSVTVGTYNEKAFYFDGTRHDIGGAGSQGLGVSPDGAYVLGQDTNPSVGHLRAFRYTVGTATMEYLGSLQPISSHESAAWDATSGATMVVGWSNKDISGGGTPEIVQEAFVWDAVNGMVGLGDLTDPNLSSDAHNSVAYAISDDGQVIVGAGRLGSGSTADDKAFVYFTDEGQMQLLSAVLQAQGVDLSHWGVDEPETGVTYPALREARDVTVNGNLVTIVGWGVNASGQEEGFVATLTLVPEPQHYALLVGVGLVGFGLLRRKHSRN